MADNLVACIGLLQILADTADTAESDGGALGTANPIARARQYHEELIVMLGALGRTIEQTRLICLEELGTPAPKSQVTVLNTYFHAFHGHCITQAHANSNIRRPLCNM